ncbi:cation:proton antiporter [bacterium]|nr:cation:proton antiporter [bacterium]
MILLTALVLLFFAYSAGSRRLARWNVTAPMVFTAAGMLLTSLRPMIVQAGMTPTVFLHLAEVGLVLLLFTDANRTDLRALRAAGSLSARLLAIGMLPTILLGAVAAHLVLGLPPWECGILGAILAPTDAGLGQVIVTSPRVPARIREALTVEAGLNDGLSVPFLLFCMALAAAPIEGRGASLTQFMVEQLGFGILVGLGVGLLAGWLLGVAARREWIAASFRQIAVVAIPLFCLIASEASGASMFIAAFVAGLAVQWAFPDAGRHSVDFAEEWGQVLNLAVFFLFGVVAARDWMQVGAPFWLYAVLSLTLVRMLPVWLALAGAGLGGPSIAFMGWFGPRGLASIVLGLVYIEQELRLPAEATIRTAVIVTVLLSIFVHGLSAGPGIAWHAARER